MTDMPRKTALFVDFDNIYLSLKRSEPRAAERFATEPWRWIEWFGRGLHRRDNDTAQEPVTGSDVLVRRCYLTPTSFGSYRSYFTRAAFTVVDCPPLTSRGKNSADIVMVMDMLDALEHQTRFDEFIALSGDADFTPVLLRLRTHDRRTVVLTNELTAAAYRAAADISVSQDTFIEDALGVDEQTPAVWRRPAYAPSAPPPDLAVVADRVRRFLGESGRTELAGLVPVFQEFPAFANSSWFGSGSLRKLCERLESIQSEIAIEDGGPGGTFVRLVDAAEPSTEMAEEPMGVVATLELPLRERVLDSVRERLSGSDHPLDMALLGNQLIEEIGNAVKDSDWAGAGTLGELIRQSGDPRLAVHIGGSGFVYDPDRHSTERLPTDASDSEIRGLEPSLAALIKKICGVTGCPRLLPEDFHVAFQVIADHSFAAEQNFLYETAALRDAAAERGHPIGRRAFNFMLFGFHVQGVDVSQVKSAEKLAAIFKANIRDLCENASLPLSKEEIDLIDVWLGISQTEDAEPIDNERPPGARQPEDAEAPEPQAWQAEPSSEPKLLDSHRNDGEQEHEESLFAGAPTLREGDDEAASPQDTDARENPTNVGSEWRFLKQ